jgi:hypothetical protein
VYMEYTKCRSAAEEIIERAKDTLKKDGFLKPLLFAMHQDGKIQCVHLFGKPEEEVADLARAAVKSTNAFAAVVANEATFAEMENGVIHKEYTFEALAVACVHPDGHAVWITPFAKEHGITFGKTRLMEGEHFSGPITEIL